MPFPREDAVQSTLAPFDARIRKAVSAGFKAFVRRAGGANVFKRTDSADIYDSVIQAMIGEFAETPDVKISRVAGLPAFCS